MERTLNTVLNGVVGFAIGYVVAARSMDRRGAVKSGLVSAAITALVAWVGYERGEDSAEPDEATA